MHSVSNFIAVRHEYIPRDLIYGGNQSLSESMSCSVPVQPPALIQTQKIVFNFSSGKRNIFKGNCTKRLLDLSLIWSK